MNWELEIIGARAGSPDRFGPASGYLLKTDAATILVDCGPGVIGQLAARDRLDDVDAVIISHRHLDHSGDLMAYAYHLAFPDLRTPIPMFGPTGFSGYVAQLDDVHGIPTLPTLQRPVTQMLPLTEVTPGDTFEVHGLRVDTVAALHPVPTMSMSFPDLGLVYTADTALTPELTKLASNTDLLLSEATYVDSAGRDILTHGHMSGVEAGQLAADSGASRLVLTHLSRAEDAEATRETATRHFDGDLSLASAGKRFLVRDGEITAVAAAPAHAGAGTDRGDH
ncbi:MAG: MBL fold metallo-hydrolase [Actinobacteria bacterium]|jgi:ribonuclease BN (tRNA processing enzyme)|nr:MBL fold metallo-hydrolase [Actinomycetota bacterium]